MRATQKNVVITVFAAILGIFSSFSSAKCSVDLKGTWQFYGPLARAITTEGATAYSGYYSCSFKTSSDGTLDSDASVCDVYTDDGQPAIIGNVASGQYVVDDNCAVSGVLNVGSAAVLEVLDAKMNRGGDEVNGIQIIDFNGRFTVPFSMFRVL